MGAVTEHRLVSIDHDRLLAQRIAGDAMAMFRAGVLGVPPTAPTEYDYLSIIQTVAEAAAWMALKFPKE